MSEQEKKSGGPGVSPAVVVEQTTNSRHKPPYRPTEIQEDSDLLHKHSRAPAVPCVAEEIKDLTIETTVKDNVEEKEQNRAKSTEMSKQNISKKLSSITKKQSSSPESIALAHLEIDTKKGSSTPPSQPIPPDVVEALSGADFTAAEKEAQKRGDTDSITDEISEGRTVETSRKYSNWSDDDEEAGGLPRSESRASRVSRVVRQFFCCGVPYEAPSEENISSGRAFENKILADELVAITYLLFLLALKLQNTTPFEKREISWKEKDFEGREILTEIGAKSRAWILERRASVGPCFRPGMPFEGPSGIAIHIPRKSMSAMRSSGININISRKNLNSKSKFNIQREKPREVMKECNQTEATEGESKLISTLKQKLNSVHSKIKNAFHY